jgi:glycosyltransferase involved in cell wall biosynthesis
MKIAIVGPAHPYKGGAAQHTTALAHRLSAAGHQVVLLSWTAQYPKLLYPGQLTVDTPELPVFGATERVLAWYRPDGWWRTGRRLARERFDALVLCVVTPIQAPAYLTLARAARAAGCTVLALCHNVLPHEGRAFDRPLMTALLRRVDAVIVHSDAEAAVAASLTTAPVQATLMPPHLPGVALAGLPQQAVPAPQPTHHRLLFFGIVRPYKGLDLLLEALAQASPAVALTVAGEIWDGRDGLLRQIAGLGLTERVTLAEGYVPAGDIPALFATADALVLPYRSATASQNPLLAFQYGVPVIATRAGPIAATVQDGVNGLLCTPGDAADLARAISQLYQPGTLARLRQGARPADPGPLWDDYLAAITKAIPAANS